MLITMVDVHNIDATSLCTFFEQSKEQFLCTDCFLSQLIVAFCFQVQFIEGIRTKLLIHLRDFVRREQSDLFIINKTLIEQLGDLNRVVQFTDAVIFSSFVVLQDKDVFDFLVPDGEVDCCASTSDAILCAASDS